MTDEKLDKKKPEPRRPGGKTKRGPKRPKRPPIKIVITFGYVTKEKFDALPEPVKDKLGRGIYAFFMKLAEKEAEEKQAAEVERETKTTGAAKKSKKGSAK